MATKVFDAVAITGTYTDHNGNEKKRYTTIGAVFENDKKQMSLKIESLPVGGEWNGWVSFYTPKEAEQPKQEKRAEPRRGSSTSNEFGDGDVIPF